MFSSEAQYVGGFSGGDYWSSTEYSQSNAWGQNVGSGGQYGSGKVNTYYVRAVRAF